MSDPSWLEMARKDIGQRETLAPNDSPWIRRMLQKLNGSWLLGQPWCGGAVAFWMQSSGIPIPKNWYRAKGWLDWERPLPSPCVGCVVIYQREGGGHVGLAVGFDSNGNILTLGGNQGDEVNIKPFSPVRVMGFRWPLGVHVPLDPMPLLAANLKPSENEA